MTWVVTLVSVGLVSAIPLTGLFLVRLRPAKLERLLVPIVSFAVGALLGGALLHLLPEAIQRVGTGRALAQYILLGFLGFFVLEQALRTQARPGSRVHPRLPPFASLNLLGDALHHLIDGMVIAAAYLAGTAVGIATTMAVILHEVPQEIGDMGVLLYGGLPVRRAVLFNLASALTAVAGAVLALVVGHQVAGFSDALLPVAVGAFLYVAAADLIPELRRRSRPGSSLRQIALVLLGVGLMALPGLLE